MNNAFRKEALYNNVDPSIRGFGIGSAGQAVADLLALLASSLSKVLSCSD